MKRSAPTRPVWLISLILAALGVLATFVAIPVVSANAFWFVVAGYVLLFLGTILKGF